MFSLRTFHTCSLKNHSQGSSNRPLFTTYSLACLLGIVLFLGSTPVSLPEAAAQQTTRVSVASDGTEGGSISWISNISADGRYVAFTSKATNLVINDANEAGDIFVHDRQTGTTERVSVASDGTEGTSDSLAPALSADGRYVVFTSEATNLVASDTNGTHDIFVHDRQTGITERVNVASDGTEANGRSWHPVLSGGGRYVAFESSATNLVAEDTNRRNDVFVHDRQTGITERVSVASDGTEGDGGSWFPSLSVEGRYVAFVSWATTLVAGDANETADVFVHDRQTGMTERVSVASDGTEGNERSWLSALSADGRYVAFSSYTTNLITDDTNGRWDVFVHDRQAGTTERVSVASDGTEGNNSSEGPVLSADGRYVAFYSAATNLVGGDTNGRTDTFVHDQQTGTTERVSVATDGMEGDNSSYADAISADGRNVAFWSYTTNLVMNDTNAVQDVFVHTRPDPVSPPMTLTVTRTGTGHGTVSSDEGHIACGVTCDADFLVGTVVTLTATADTGSAFAGWSGGTDWTGTSCSGTDTCTVIMTQDHDVTATFTALTPTEGDLKSEQPAVSADRRYVAFSSLAKNLVPGDTNQRSDVFVHDRETGTVTRVSVASDGTQGNKRSWRPALSAQGRYVVFESDATTLVPGDTNGTTDVFLHDRQTHTTTRVSVTVDGSQGDGPSTRPVVSPDGRLVAFASSATNLVVNDTNSQSDIFVYDRDTETLERVSVESGGIQWEADSTDPAFSADGTLVVFTAKQPNNPRAIYVHDRESRTTELASVNSLGVAGKKYSQKAVLSGDGQTVVFESLANNFVQGDRNRVRDIFVRDLNGQTTIRISEATDGTDGDAESTQPAVNTDGSVIVFSSLATNLVEGDTNSVEDVFVYDAENDTIARVSVARDGTDANGASMEPVVSADGRYVVFTSVASNLVASDTNGQADVFVYDRQTGTTTRVSVPE